MCILIGKGEVMKSISLSKKALAELKGVFDRHIEELGLRQQITLVSMGYAVNGKFTIIKSGFVENKRFGEE